MTKAQLIGQVTPLLYLVSGDSIRSRKPFAYRSHQAANLGANLVWEEEGRCPESYNQVDWGGNSIWVKDMVDAVVDKWRVEDDD